MLCWLMQQQYELREPSWALGEGLTVYLFDLLPFKRQTSAENTQNSKL